MRVFLTVFFALVLVPHEAGSQASSQLDALIQRNIEDAKRPYEFLLRPDDRSMITPRLWLHYEADDQKLVGQEILDSLKEEKLQGRAIALKPMRQVDTAPPMSQLRFFKKGDEGEARDLLRLLQKRVPQLQLMDLSDKYASVGWLKPGHYELWLSPELRSIEPAK